MNCNDARPLLDLLCDGELAAKDSALVLDHLRDCHECRSEWDDLEQLRARFVESKGKPALPPDMMARISQSLQIEDRKTSRRGFAATPFALLVAASILALGVLLSPLVLHNYGTNVDSALADAHTLVVDTAAENTLDVVKDESELNRKVGYDLKHVQLPDWNMYRSGMYRSDHPTAIARFDFVQKNPGGSYLTCYQAKQGTIQARDAQAKQIGDKLVHVGTCDKCQYALWSEHGRDYLFVSKMPLPNLEEIVRGA